MEFRIHTQDGFTDKGTKNIETLEELMEFVSLNHPHNVIVSTGEITVMNIGEKDKF